MDREAEAAKARGRRGFEIPGLLNQTQAFANHQVSHHQIMTTILGAALAGGCIPVLCLQPILDDQAFCPVEMPDVVGHHHRPERKRMPGDHFIKHPDAGAGQLQLCAQLGVRIRRGRVPGRNPIHRT